MIQQPHKNSWHHSFSYCHQVSWGCLLKCLSVWTMPWTKSTKMFTHIIESNFTIMYVEKVLNENNFQGSIQDFWKGGSNPSKGSLFSTFYLIFHKFPYEIEICWFQRWVPSKSATDFSVVFCNAIELYLVELKINHFFFSNQASVCSCTT